MLTNPKINSRVKVKIVMANFYPQAAIDKFNGKIVEIKEVISAMTGRPYVIIKEKSGIATWGDWFFTEDLEEIKEEKICNCDLRRLLTRGCSCGGA